MSGFLQKIIDSFWLQPISLFLSWALLIIVSLERIPEPPKTCSWADYIIWGVYFLLELFYTFLVYKHTSLPKGKTTASSVLFVIDAENSQFYNDVEKKLISKFEDCNTKRKGEGFSAICISKSRLKKYDFNNQESMIELLFRVNCIIVVFIKHRVDSVSNAENYELQVDYGILHPGMDKQFSRFLQIEMRKLASPIKSRRFVKASNIVELSFTAVALDVICQDLVGLVMLLSGHYREAYNRLRTLYQYIKSEKPNYSIPGIETVLKKRLYVACVGLLDESFQDYFFDGNPESLEAFNQTLEEMNAIIPETYHYYINKAYYLVAKNADIAAAKKCISKCKKFKGHQTWRYSEAFLAAYEEKNPMTIYKKYMQAFKSDPNHNLCQIGEFIERMLEKEPQRLSLHFAAGLVYFEFGQAESSNAHFSYYFEKKGNLEEMKQLLCNKQIWNSNKAA